MDPTVVYGCECVICGAYQTDNENDVDARGVCWDCVEEEQEATEETDAFDTRTEWFSVAAGIVL
jgi:rhamnogalacturonyl hydrolase YesR